MHLEQRILHQQNTPHGNFTILPTEVANLPTETGSGGCRTPPLAPGLYTCIKALRATLDYLLQHMNVISLLIQLLQTALRFAFRCVKHTIKISQ